MNTQSDCELSSSNLDGNLVTLKSSSRSQEVNRHRNLKNPKKKKKRMIKMCGSMSEDVKLRSAKGKRANCMYCYLTVCI